MRTTVSVTHFYSIAQTCDLHCDLHKAVVRFAVVQILTDKLNLFFLALSPCAEHTAEIYYKRGTEGHYFTTFSSHIAKDNLLQPSKALK